MGYCGMGIRADRFEDVETNKEEQKEVAYN